MNRGLKNYTKQIQENVNNVIINVNLNEEDNNVILQIPLLETIGVNPFSSSLIFNKLSLSEDGYFGLGTKLNYYGKVIDGTDLSYQNADGSIDTYLFDKHFENKETNASLMIVSEDDYDIHQYYCLQDKYGNKKEYYEDLMYPEFIYINNEKLTLDFVSEIKTIKNEYNDEISFILNNGKVNKVIYKHNNEELQVVELEYINNIISNVKYKQNGVIVKEIDIVIDEEKIIVLDKISLYRIKLFIENNKVIKIIKGYDEEFNYSHPLQILYNKNLTTLIDDKNKKNYLFFDNDNLPLYEIDEEGNVIKFEYDKETKKLLSQSNVIPRIGLLPNLLPSLTLNKFKPDRTILVRYETVNEEYLKNVIGNETWKIENKENKKNTFTYTLPINGLAGDELTLIIWGKQYISCDKDNYVEVELSAGNQITTKFNKKEVDELFEVKILGVNPLKSYDNVTIKITLNPNTSISLGGIQLIRKESGLLYSYDENGNRISSSFGNKANNIQYENNMPSLSIGVDSSMCRYKYDNNHNLIETKTGYGVKIENKYSTTYKNNLISTEISNASKTRTIKTSKEYSSDGRFVVKEIDERNNETKYDYDALGRIIRITDGLENINEYEYNLKGLLNKIKLIKNNESNEIKYLYDERNRIKEVTLPNLEKYSFKYNEIGNISSISINDIEMFKYEYDLQTGNLIKQLYALSNEGYIFEYKDDLINKIYYLNPNQEKTLRYVYNYNKLKQIESIVDVTTSLETKYNYDEKGNVIKKECNNITLTKNYDSNNKLNGLVINNGEDNDYVLYDNKSLNEIHPEVIEEYYKQDNSYIGVFNFDTKLRSTNDKMLKSVSLENTETNIMSTFEGGIPCVDLSRNELRYNLICNEPRANYELGVMFWFKTTDFTKLKYLFCTTENGYRKRITATLETDGTVSFYVVDNDGKSYTLMKSTEKAKLNEWNFFALSFLEGQMTNGNNKCVTYMMLNDDFKIYEKEKPNFSINLSNKVFYNIGCVFDEYGGYFNFDGMISCLNVSKRLIYSIDDMAKYYYLTKMYIFDHRLSNNNINSLSINQIKVFSNIDNTFEVFPLQNNVNSLTGIKPIKFDLRQQISLDRNVTFVYNKELNKRTLACDGNKLMYGFNKKQVTVLINAFIDISKSKQYIFDSIDEDNNKVSLYRDDKNYLCAEINETVYKTKFKLNNNEWHTIGLVIGFKFGTEVNYHDQLNQMYRLNKVIFDENEEYFTSSIIEYKPFKIMIGRRINEIDITSTDGQTTYDSQPLYGRVEMLCFNDSVVDIKTIKELKNNLMSLTKTNKYDEMGTLLTTTFSKNNNEYIKKEYIYLDNSNKIKKESINLLNQTYEKSYTYDALGRIKTVVDTMFTNKVYGYDYRGFLIREPNITYTYDDNGNILTKGNTTFTYDENIKDKLIKVNNDEVIYSNDNLLNPIKYKNNTYKYEGRRLTKFNNGNKEYEYLYNDQGLRVAKTDGWDIINEYYYDEDRLIYEKTMYGDIKYLYDENNLLYGFIYNEQKYIYIRDVLQNILGIATEEGKVVVKYDYTAYGEIVEVYENTNYELSKINPFRYKGYYYDEESKMYYCKTRYYVPEWCRWLNTDSPLFLDFNNIQSTNLFSYCGNDPVNNVDPTGHSWESFWNGVGDWFSDHWVELAIGTAFIIGGAVVTALTCGAGTTAWAAFGSALLSSAIQVGAGIGTGVLVNGVSNLIQGNDFFDNVGDTIASSYMLGGILSGGSQMLSGGFRFLRAKTGFKGIDSTNFGFMSADKLYYDKPGMTVLRLGSRKGAKLAIDFGRYGIHGHIWKWSTHIPLIPGIVGISELF